MKITPKSESQLSEAGLWPDGIYDFEVIGAKEGVSKRSQQPMITLEHLVYDSEGKTRKVRDYLLESVAFKLRHFCYATGLGDKYEAGEVEADDMLGRCGKLRLRIEPGDDQFDAKNSVKDYIEAEQQEKPAGKNPVVKVTPSDDINSPPF